jgi:hypothetical protein
VAQPSGKLETKHRHLLFATSKPVPQPGSTVFVPEKDPNDKRDWNAITASIASVTASLIGIVAILKR